MGAVSYGLLPLIALVSFTFVEGLKCGQTVCSADEYCCEHKKNCCCSEGPSGWSFHCSESHSFWLRWYEILIIVVLVVGVCAAITACVICYWRRRRNVNAYDSM